MPKIEFYTSESVTEGHPDKICDQISDAILDAHLEQDPNARVAVETLATKGRIFIAGEVTSTAKVEERMIALRIMSDIGTEGNYLLTSHISQQSPDIAQGVDTGGAGDQGMMYGYATNETKELMPLPIVLAHKMAKRLSDLRKSGEVTYFKSDGKTQVTVEYHDGVPKRVSSVVVAIQHDENVPMQKLKWDVLNKVIYDVCGWWMDKETKIHINGTGKFVIGGPEADTGLTGRKIIVDTYGGIGRHGGGAFSGKDPSKVDRSGAYAARWVAKNIVAKDFADKCEVQISYCIGVAEPTSINVNTFGTNKIPEEEIVSWVRKTFDLTPKGIIQALKLRRPIYRKTAAYGHFGRDDPDFTWEGII